MVVLEWLLIAGLGGLVVVTIANAVKNDRKQRSLEAAFCQLLEAENGCVSLIQLMVAAQVDAETARQYLEAQAKVLNALPEVDADGDRFYRFPKLHRSPEA